MMRRIRFSPKSSFEQQLTDEDKERQNDVSARHFIANMKRFQDDANKGSINLLSDFTLKSEIDGKVCKAHKMILASQSKYFMVLFRNNPNICSTLLHYEHSVIDACLQGIYTGTSSLTGDNVQDILIAADYLGVDDLFNQATDFIILHMDDTNCYDILKFGCDRGIDKMASSAASYIGRRLCDPGKNIEELYSLPSEMFSKVLRSNWIIMKENASGVIMTGLARELLIFPFIKKMSRTSPRK